MVGGTESEDHRSEQTKNQTAFLGNGLPDKRDWGDFMAESQARTTHHATSRTDVVNTSGAQLQQIAGRRAQGTPVVRLQVGSVRRQARPAAESQEMTRPNKVSGKLRPGSRALAQENLELGASGSGGGASGPDVPGRMEASGTRDGRRSTVAYVVYISAPCAVVRSSRVPVIPSSALRSG